jgi:demethylmenaquinone methyltransferase/2-methoxy-6-polyprenyl-1,4-benzoquinol methylase
MFAGIAGAYDLNNRIHSFGRDQAWRCRAVALAELRPGERVLDVACGTGDLTECFARAGAGECVGVDFTEPMLDIARTKALRLPPARRPHYVAGDAMSLDLPDRAVDVVSIAFGIRNLAEPRVALAEFRRVLRPRGRLVVLEFTRPANPLLRFFNDLYTRHLMPWSAGLLARDRVGAYRYLPRSVETFLDHHALRQAIEREGFQVRQQELLTFGVVAVTVATPAP